MKAKAFAVWGIALCAWAGAHTAWAQDTRLAGQALHCAAVLDVLAQTHAGQTEKTSRWQRAVSIFTEVHLKALGESGAAAQEQALLRRQQALVSVRAQGAERAAYFREDAVVCGAWAEGVLAQGERYQYLVVYPKVIAPHIRSQYQ